MDFILHTQSQPGDSTGIAKELVADFPCNSYVTVFLSILTRHKVARWLCGKIPPGSAFSKTRSYDGCGSNSLLGLQGLRLTLFYTYTPTPTTSRNKEQGASGVGPGRNIPKNLPKYSATISPHSAVLPLFLPILR
eukprot:scaffold144821_cov36-Tisochrysis_lutea.AAC.1